MSSPVLSMRISAGYPGKPDAVRDVSLNISKGEILGLVGQSGCGKSTLSLAVMRLLHLKNGKMNGVIDLNGRDILRLSTRDMRGLRGKEVALVLQSPMSSLNPALRIGTQMEEAWKVHRRGSRDECRQDILQSFVDVALPSDPEFLKRRPAQLSVGQAQRVLIAMSILHRPTLLIADEPTSALDIITQAEILELFAKLSAKFGMSLLYISHDLLSVATISNRVAVMHEGEIVECKNTVEIFRDPQHEYTRQLIRALPVVPNFAARAVSN